MKYLVIFFMALILAAANHAGELAVDFGELQPKSETTRRVKISNDGTNTVLLASIRCDAGVRAAISRDCLFPGDKAALNVTVSTGTASGDFEASIELHAIGADEAWRKIKATGRVVDGALAGSVLPSGISGEVWKCADDVALLERASFGETWRAVFDENIARLADYHITARDKYVARRLASRALKEACDAADDEWSTQFKIPKPAYNYGHDTLDDDAAAAHEAMMARINEKARKAREAHERMIAEENAKEAERKRQEELKHKEWLENIRKQNEAFAVQKRAKEEAVEREKAAVRWTPPKYFTDKFFSKVWIKFLMKELQIPNNKHGRGYRDVLWQGFSAYKSESDNPFKDACDTIKTNKVWNIDRRLRCGRELHECFTRLFGGGGLTRIKMSKEGEEEKWVRGNIAAAMSAWDDRRGELWRMLGYLWRPMYCGGDLSWKDSVDAELAEGVGEKGVAAAVAWCKALAEENPDDDTWQKCAYPLLKGALAPRDELLEPFLAGIKEFLNADAWLIKTLEPFTKENSARQAPSAEK